jgi:hypothetical protein
MHNAEVGLTAFVAKLKGGNADATCDIDAIYSYIRGCNHDANVAIYLIVFVLWRAE